MKGKPIIEMKAKKKLKDTHIHLRLKKKISNFKKLSAVWISKKKILSQRRRELWDLWMQRDKLVLLQGRPNNSKIKKMQWI